VDQGGGHPIRVYEPTVTQTSIALGRLSRRRPQSRKVKSQELGRRQASDRPSQLCDEPPGFRITMLPFATASVSVCVQCICGDEERYAILVTLLLHVQLQVSQLFRRSSSTRSEKPSFSSPPHENGRRPLVPTISMLNRACAVMIRRLGQAPRSVMQPISAASHRGSHEQLGTRVRNQVSCEQFSVTDSASDNLPFIGSSSSRKVFRVGDSHVRSP
jgi:hypothetical protein